MKKERLKLVSAMLLLSGFSTGYVQAVPHAAAVEMYSVQQDNTCTGVVVDQNGETVIGASVVVKGTTNGTVNDEVFGKLVPEDVPGILAKYGA